MDLVPARWWGQACLPSTVLHKDGLELEIPTTYGDKLQLIFTDTDPKHLREFNFVSSASR